MRLFKRSDNAHYDGGGLDKYFVKCKDPNNTDSWLQNPFSMDVNNERAIVSALIHDGYARHNQKVVIKVGKSELIRKEYQIGERLKNVPGFIRYICAMQCHDDLEKYKKNAAFSICSKETHNDLMNVLIMPYHVPRIGTQVFVGGASHRAIPVVSQADCLIVVCSL